MWTQLLNALIGIWLMAAPEVLGLTGGARTTFLIVGPIAVSAAVIAIWEVTRGVRWLNVPLGAWLVLAPWILTDRTLAFTVTSTVSGILLVLFSLPAGSRTSKYGGGWAALWKSSE